MSSSTTRVDGDFPVHFRYTAGIAGERFFREIMENERLVASRCPRCNLNYLPPRIYCEKCLSKLTDYVSVENVGSVEAFTLCHRDSAGNALAQPIGVALVRFQGAHGGIVHRTKEVMAIGDRVRAVFVAKARRVGSILDIEHFEKIPDADV